MAETLDNMSAAGLDEAVEKAFEAAQKDVYEYEGKTTRRTRRRPCCR